MKIEKKTIAMLIFSILVSIGLSGCYTLLKHPTVDNGGAREDYRDCASCHGQFVHPSPYDMYYYSGIWNEYYYLPWWYNTFPERDYDDYFFTAPRRGILRREVIPARESDTMKGMGTSRARLKSPRATEQKRSSERKETTDVRVKDRSTSHDKSSPTRNIIKRRSVKEKNKESPEKK